MWITDLRAAHLYQQLAAFQADLTQAERQAATELGAGATVDHLVPTPVALAKYDRPLTAAELRTWMGLPSAPEPEAIEHRDDPDGWPQYPHHPDRHH